MRTLQLIMKRLIVIWRARRSLRTSADDYPNLTATGHWELWSPNLAAVRGTRVPHNILIDRGMGRMSGATRLVVGAVVRCTPRVHVRPTSIEGGTFDVAILSRDGKPSKLYSTSEQLFVSVRRSGTRPARNDAVRRYYHDWIPAPREVELTIGVRAAERVNGTLLRLEPVNRQCGAARTLVGHYGALARAWLHGPGAESQRGGFRRDATVEHELNELQQRIPVTDASLVLHLVTGTPTIPTVGDLHAGNILLDEMGNPVVIDIEDGMIGLRSWFFDVMDLISRTPGLRVSYWRGDFDAAMCGLARNAGIRGTLMPASRAALALAWCIWPRQSRLTLANQTLEPRDALVQRVVGRWTRTWASEIAA